MPPRQQGPAAHRMQIQILEDVGFGLRLHRLEHLRSKMFASRLLLDPFQSRTQRVGSSESPLGDSSRP